MVWTWKDQTIATMGDTMTAVIACQTPEEFEAFMNEYRRFMVDQGHESTGADDNISFGLGYESREEDFRMRNMGVLRCFHMSSSWTDEEARVLMEKAGVKEETKR